MPQVRRPPRWSQVEVILGPTNKTYNAGHDQQSPRSSPPAPLVPSANQWYFNTVSNFSTATRLTNSSHLAGVTTAILLIITNIVAGDAGYYWAACTNVAGFVIPEAAVLTVTVSPPG